MLAIMATLLKRSFNLPGFLSIERITAPPEFNRWRILPAAIVIHLCIGSIYAWSIYNPALIRTLGIVTSAPDDWTLRQVRYGSSPLQSSLPGLQPP